jgi:CheY-like chemotaxis protein
MPRVRLIHWKAGEAGARVEQLEAAGFRVEFSLVSPPDLFRKLKSDPPDAVVIDLTRLPSHGREIAGALRKQKATRRVPLVFVEGEAEKVARIRALLPDAVYTSWSRIRSALKRAIAHPPAAPVVPLGMMERYAGTPLVKKLGIKPNVTAALIDPPRSFDQTLGALPDGAALQEGLTGRFQVVVWFVRSADDLRRGIGRVSTRLGAATLWIAWPKQASGVATELKMQIIREVAMDAGLVDYKTCAIDATWSGLAFVRRKT